MKVSFDDKAKPFIDSGVLDVIYRDPNDKFSISNFCNYFYFVCYHPMLVKRGPLVGAMCTTEMAKEIIEHPTSLANYYDDVFNKDLGKFQAYLVEKRLPNYKTALETYKDNPFPNVDLEWEKSMKVK